MMQSLLNTFNLWWTSEPVPKALVGRYRTIFKELKFSLILQQISVLTGLRPMGKTTLLFQLIDVLLEKGIPPFLNRFYSDSGLMITLDQPGIFTRNQHRVQLIPNRKFQTILPFIDSQLNKPRPKK